MYLLAAAISLPVGYFVISWSMNTYSFLSFYRPEQLFQENNDPAAIHETKGTEILQALNAEIDTLRSRPTRTSRSRILTSLPANRKALQAAWDQAQIGWRRGLVMAVIDRIEVAPAARGRNRFDPERLTITWHA